MKAKVLLRSTKIKRKKKTQATGTNNCCAKNVCRLNLLFTTAFVLVAAAVALRHTITVKMLLDVSHNTHYLQSSDKVYIPEIDPSGNNNNDTSDGQHKGRARKFPLPQNNHIINVTVTKKFEKHYNASIEIDSFFFIHTPKTGTSLYTVLRNRLKSCKVKDFTCFGVHGGGLHAHMTKDKIARHPFSAKSLRIEDEREVSCGKTLNCPPHGPAFHCPYDKPVCRRQRNKVTLFREPEKWFKSSVEWHWLGLMTQKKKTNFSLPWWMKAPMEFATGKSRVDTIDDAFEIAQNEYLWWGVTDYWPASVCVFHCELGGEERESETRDVRSSTQSQSWMWNITELEATLPKEKHRSALVPNYTKYVEEKYQGEIAFYHTKIMPEFRRRASVCGCALL